MSRVERSNITQMVVIGKRSSLNKDQNYSLADFVVDDLSEIPKILNRL